MYEVKFDKNALDFLSKLDRNLRERIWNKIQQCKENPFHFLEHLEEIEGYKLRVGDYRLIVDIDISSKILTILKIGHRKNIYEN